MADPCINWEINAEEFPISKHGKVLQDIERVRLEDVGGNFGTGGINNNYLTGTGYQECAICCQKCGTLL